MAITGTITATPEVFLDKASQAERSVSIMKARFDDLKSVMEATANFWTGTAGDAHRAQFQKQLPAIEEMFQRYQEHINDLREISGVYTQTNKTVVSWINNMIEPDFD